MRNQSPPLPQYPSPTDKSSVAAQFGLTNTNTHSHSGAGMDGGQIDYKNLLNKPTIPTAQPQGASALGTTGAVSLNPALGNVFTITPTGATQITPSSFPAGYIIVIRILTSGTTPYTITFDVGFVANGTLTTVNLTGRYYTAIFACDGTYWNELARTVAMLPS